jgi:pteridine reductase
MELQGKTALITGAAHRIGAAIAEHLASRGCRIALHYHASSEAAETTLKRLKTLGAEAVSLQADLSLPGEAARLLHRAVALGFSPNILINSAAIYPDSKWEDVEWFDFESTLKLNSFAPLSMTREFSRIPRAEAVINLLDARMVDYDRNHFAYHISKRILHDFTRIMSVELAPKITVNAVAPGIILPDRENDPELLEKYRKGNLLKKIGSVEEITRTVLFLLQSDFITGQVIFVDGGRHIRGRLYGS